MNSHGIELDDDGRPEWFRFGMLRLVHSLYLSPFEQQPPGIPKWARIWGTNAFMSVLGKFQDTVWKFDRAAGHVARCRDHIRRQVERDAKEEDVNTLDSEYAAYMSAREDLPLYLDLMLLYLRIEADAFAQMVPYFYPRGGTIPTRSFRNQRDWFLSPKSKLDPGYSAILRESCGWFDQLAGKDPNGLRDVIVHHGGTHQVGWSVPGQDASFSLRAALVTHEGFAESDLLGALVAITKGWFEFLDRCFAHFVSRLQPVVIWTDISQDHLSRFMRCGGIELPSFWVYPRANR